MALTLSLDVFVFIAVTAAAPFIPLTPTAVSASARFPFQAVTLAEPASYGPMGLVTLTRRR